MTPYSPERNWKERLPFVMVVVACILAMALLRLGLPGGFLLDDYPNLESLGKWGGIKGPGDVVHYLQQASSGPTGRPLSMLSFLLDAVDWPSEPAPFKFKNILIHLASGMLLFGLLRLIVTQAGVMRNSTEAAWVAALAAVFWVLHPFHVSTVLYVVQRMAQLSTFFVFAGLLGYFYGRQWLEQAPMRAYRIMSISLVLGTLLAVLSKENGALLPLLAWVIELVLFSRPDTKRPDRRWSALFLILPSLAILGYLGYQFWMGLGAPSVYSGLTVGERLLTEPRILVEYLWYLAVPQPHTLGIFRDAYSVSRSLFDPVSTLPALLFVTALLASAIGLRRRLPLFSVAVLFFFAGHLIESTVVMLELYYEHRNYLPAALLFLPLAQWLVVGFRQRPRPMLALIGVLVLVLSAMLGARSELWSDRTRLFLMWAIENPHSERAQISIANEFFIGGNGDAAVARLEEGIGNLPDSLMLRLHLLRFKAVQGALIGRAEIEAVRELAGRVRVTQEAVVAMELLTAAVENGKALGLFPATVEGIWRSFLDNPSFTTLPELPGKTYHYLGVIEAGQGRVKEAMEWFDKALKEWGNMETGVMEVAVLATRGHFCEALLHLDRAEGLLATDEEARKREAYYRQELVRLRQTLQEDARSEGLKCEGGG